VRCVGRAGSYDLILTVSRVPTIYWIQPSGTATRYVHSTVNPPDTVNDDDDGTAQENEGSLLIESSSLNSAAGVESNSLLGMYICVADNEAGNVTLTISVPAASQPPPLYQPSTSLHVHSALDG